jgi:ABC-type transporter Mla subunit MlaD
LTLGESMVWEIALVIFLLVLSMLTLLLIPTVLQIRSTLSKASAMLETVNKNLPAILQDVNQITTQAAKAGAQIQNAVDDIIYIERKISHYNKRPALEIAAALGALLQTIQRILSIFSRKK